MFSLDRIRRVGATTLVTSAAGLLAACGPVSEPETPSGAEAVTLADYRRAETYLAANTAPLVINAVQAQHWQDDDSLIYQLSTAAGFDLLHADIAARSSTSLVDGSALAQVLSSLKDEEIEAPDLRISDLEFDRQQGQLQFSHSGDRYRLQLDSMDLSLLNHGAADEFLSPDGSKAVFIQGHNLWLRDTLSNELTQLTFDGFENYGYATNNAGWLRDASPVLKW